MNTIKILLIIQTPPPFGGGEIQALSIKNYFSKFNNYIIYDYSRENRNRYLQGRVSLRNIIFGMKWVYNCIHLIKIHKPAKIYFTLPKGFAAFLRNCIVICYSKKRNIKVLGELPGASFLFLEHSKNIKYKIGLYFLKKIYEIRLLSICIQKSLARFELSTIVINNGINFDITQHVKKEVFENKELNLLYIGSLEYSKGIKNILIAAKLCKENNLNVKFNIAGNWVHDFQKNECLKIIKENHLNNIILFHGFVEAYSKIKLFSTNAILLHPTYWDGVPLSILEALAVGMTIISTPIGGIPDTIEHNVHGKLLKHNTPSELFRAIRFFYQNRDILIKNSYKNRSTFSEKYTEEKFLNSMKDWFEK